MYHESSTYVTEIVQIYNTSQTLQYATHLDVPTYCQTSNISRTLVGNKIVDHSDLVGASLVGAAPTTSQFST